MQWRIYYIIILNDETNSINDSLNNKANIDHWHANMKCRETAHWFSAEWTGASLQLWVDESNIFDTANFQAGVDTLYNACVSCGQTPSDKSPTSISNAIQDIYNNRYNEGYNNGRTQGQNDVKGNPNGYGLYTQQQYDQNYTNGYNAGVSAGQGTVAGSYRLDFRINAHDEKVNQWIRYVDQITLNIKSNGTASLGAPSFMNAQIRPEQGEYCNITKV